MKSKPRILVVDDEPLIRNGIRDYLEAKGYEVTAAADGRSALDAFERAGGASDNPGSHDGPFSLILLDLMLPDIAGEDICREIRKTSLIPIIMITAKVSEDEVVEGLRAGADDYVKKPFGMKELIARIETQLRRADQAVGAGVSDAGAAMSWNGGDLAADFESADFTKAGAPVKLTPTEQRILAALSGRPGRIFTRDELIDAALGQDFDGYDRSVDAHIKNLRAKIEDDPRAPVYIITVHGLGYKFGGA
jgi:DNA-binding response OmpR family regulator